MTTWLVTRHPGALAWLQSQGFREVRHVPHLDPKLVKPDDAVVGTLPLHLAAEVCGKGARFLGLSIDVPAELRGRELTSDELVQLGARLEQYEVQTAPANERPGGAGLDESPGSQDATSRWSDE
ncbi:MAG: CRISPR-associated protein Csx16 [Xanthomonadales bacterium]|nr:CRISPR-associated protein Csx16 [Xanthomonadales bacterium]